MNARVLGPGSLKRVQRGNTPPQWVFTWTDAQGLRHRQALSTDKRVAQMRTSEIVRQRDMELAGLSAVEGMSTPLAELATAYVADLATRATPAHVANTKAALERMLREVKAVRVRDLRAYEVLQARARLLATDLAPRTVNIHVDKLRAMLTWAVDAGLVAQNPIARLKRLPDGEAHARCRRRAMTDDEIARFLAAAEADDAENEKRVVGEAARFTRRTLRHRGLRIPQAPFWMAALETAARYGELRALTWADVDLDRCVVTLRAETTKAGKSRRIPIRREFAAVLERLRELHVRALGPDLGHVFLSPERRPHRGDTTNAMRGFDRLLVAAGIERVNEHGRKLDIHALRHTAATRFARAGVPLVQTQRILGHADPKLTAKVYTHLDVDDLRDAVEMASAKRVTHKHLEASA